MVTSFPGDPRQDDSSDEQPPSPKEPTPINSARRSRLDREVDEILSSAMHGAPLPPTPIASHRSRTHAGPPPADRIRSLASVALGVLMAVPLITAVGCGIACAIVAPYSPLFATVFATLALVVLVIPYIQAARGSSMPGSDSAKMWRGQRMDPPSIRSSGIGERTPADKINDWFNSRRSS